MKYHTLFIFTFLMGNFLTAQELEYRTDGSMNWGTNTTADNTNATAWGTDSEATGISSTAWGNGSDATGFMSTAWGFSNQSTAYLSTAWGQQTLADTLFATAWGLATQAKGERSTAWGTSSRAIGSDATAWGSEAEATGYKSTAWGDRTEAHQENATAWGAFTDAIGYAATAWGSSTDALATYATAWGRLTTADTTAATAWGRNTAAHGMNSTATGLNTAAHGENSFVIGLFNDSLVAKAAPITATSPLFIVGNGDSGSPSNALVVRKDGEVEVGGILDINSTNNVALQVDGKEAIWWDPSANYVSWGFGSDYNFFRDEVRIGGSGAGAPAYQLEVIGNADISGTLTHNSDRRLKKNIKTIGDALSTVEQLQPRSYHFRTDDFEEQHLASGQKMGFIAQELQEVLPDLVSSGKEISDVSGNSFNVQSVNYLELIPLLTKAIQEQQEIIDSQSEQLKKQDAKYQQLEKRMKRFELLAARDE